MTISIGLLEDEDLTRLTLAAALEARGYKVPVVAETVKEFIAKCSSHWVDVAILDLYLGPGPTNAAQPRVLNSEFEISLLSA